MHTFTIRDIENLSGIKAHTLRVWEQRYGIVRPRRKESNHRTYGPDDLKHILRISFLYHHGYKISRIAEMADDEIRTILLDFSRKGNYEVFVNQLIEASMDLDEERFRNSLENISFHLGTEQTINQVIYPFLNKIGMLWMTGNVIPSQEHFSSNIIRNRLLVAIQKAGIRTRREDVCFVLLCPIGEYHEIPLLAIQYLLKQKGIPVIFFGSNTSTEELKELMAKRNATHLFVHMITNCGDLDPQAWTGELMDLFPDVTILAAGKLFSGLESERIKVFTNMAEFNEYLASV